MNTTAICLIIAVVVALASSQGLQQLVTQDGATFERPGPPDFCLEGPFHKEVPSPEEDEFDECLSWQDKACCNVEVPRTIDNHKAVGLYNYSWDLCGTLSQGCETFIKDEECFYQCEPMLGHFQIGTTGYIAHVPVCASYCEQWFQACRTDLTCVVNWLEDFDYAVNGNNSCPANSTCQTFEEVYGNAEGLCNRMWGDAFFYSTDTNNCTVMAFDNTMPNPNFQLSFPTDGGAEHVVFSTVAVVMAAVAPLLLA